MDEPASTAPIRVGAAIDIGSNSAHLLVAAVGAGGGSPLVPLVDESVFLGLGERVAATGALGAEAREATVAALAGFAATARSRGVADDALLLLGTEPVRRAADGPLLAAEVEAALGVPLRILDHDEEAWLTALAITGGRTPAGPLVIVDSGGGSTEVALLAPGRAPVASGFRLGTASLTAAVAPADPPTADDLARLETAAARILAGLAPVPGARVVGLGGTVSNLAKLLPPPGAGGADAADRRLTGDLLRPIEAELLATPAAALVADRGLNPRRAPLMAAGLAIVRALLARLGADAIEVSEASCREGAIVARALAGVAWRERLASLVAGGD
jgi:exopolyphosphatase/guanosine-5'-triphosphate,3'-diphosphate pyrophosphatase